MNTAVLYTTLVCLAIVSGVKCEVNSSHVNINDFQQHELKNDTVSNSTQPSVDFQDLLKDKNQYEEDVSLLKKCQKSSRQAELIPMIKKGNKDFYICLETRNVTEIIKKMHGPISGIDDSSFKSLCKKVPDFHYCAKNITDAIRECLNEQENAFITTIQTVSMAVESFICQNDAERMSEFFSNGGINCIKNRKSAISQCMNTLTSSLANKTGHVESLKSYSFLNKFKFTEEQCDDVHKLHNCVVNELRQCDHPTAANLGNSIFELIFRNTPCNKFMKPNEV